MRVVVIAVMIIAGMAVTGHAKPVQVCVWTEFSTDNTVSANNHTALHDLAPNFVTILKEVMPYYDYVPRAPSPNDDCGRIKFEFTKGESSQWTIHASVARGPGQPNAGPTCDVTLLHRNPDLQNDQNVAILKANWVFAIQTAQVKGCLQDRLKNPEFSSVFSETLVLAKRVQEHCDPVGGPGCVVLPLPAAQYDSLGRSTFQIDYVDRAGNRETVKATAAGRCADYSAEGAKFLGWAAKIDSSSPVELEGTHLLGDWNNSYVFVAEYKRYYYQCNPLSNPPAATIPLKGS